MVFLIGKFQLSFHDVTFTIVEFFLSERSEYTE